MENYALGALRENSEMKLKEMVLHPKQLVLIDAVFLEKNVLCTIWFQILLHLFSFCSADYFVIHILRRHNLHCILRENSPGSFLFVFISVILQNQKL